MQTAFDNVESQSVHIPEEEKVESSYSLGQRALAETLGTALLVLVGPGSVVEIKNTGKMTHELSTPDHTDVMPIERLAPGSARHVKFGAPGGYVVRDAEYPHIMISVIVVADPSSLRNFNLSLPVTRFLAKLNIELEFEFDSGN